MLDFKTEKTRLLDIMDGHEHRLKRDQWLTVKRVLDEIQKKLLPMQSEQSVGFSYTKIKSNISHLKLLLEDMRQQGFVNDIKDYRGRIADYHSTISFKIRNIYDFEDYKKAVSDFYQKIEEDGVQRFPSYYMETILQWYQLHQLPFIQYNPASGIGNTNGQQFRLQDGSRDYLVFNELFAHIRSKIDKQTIASVLGQDTNEANTIDTAKVLTALSDNPAVRRKTSEAVTTTMDINDIAKSIRAKTFLDERQLVQNNSSLTLLAQEKEV